MNEPSSEFSEKLENIHQLNNENESLTFSDVPSDDDNFGTFNEYKIDDDDLTVDNFCAMFNSKFSVSTTTLREVADLIDVLTNEFCPSPEEPLAVQAKIDDLRLKSKQLKEKNNELIDQLQNLTIQNTNLQTKYDEANTERKRYIDITLQLEQKLNNVNQELKDTKESLMRAQNKSKGLESSFTEIAKMLQQQIDETSELSSQRNKLVSLCTQQQEIIANMETINHQLQSEKKPAQQVEKIPDNFLNGYEILNSICKLATDTLPPPSISDIRIIKETSEKSIMERINAVVLQIIAYNKGLEETLAKQQKATDSAIQQRNNVEKQAADILILLEDELKFLQRLATTNDLQNTIFLRPERCIPLTLDDQAKEQMLLQAVKIGAFIEDSKLQFDRERVQRVIDESDHSLVFSLLEPNTLQAKLEEFNSKITGDVPLIVRELYALFAAQVIMNDLLHNMVIEYRLRMDNIVHEQAQSAPQIKALVQELKRMHRRQERIRRAVGQFIEISEDRDVVGLVKDALEALSSSSIEQNSPNTSNISEVSNISQQMEDIIKRLEEKNNELTEDNEKLTEEIMKAKTENALLKQDIKNRDIEISDKANKLELLQKETKEALQSSNNENTRLNTELKKAENTAKITEENHRKEITEQRCKLEECQKLLDESRETLKKTKSEKRELKQRVDLLESANIKSVQSLKDQQAALRRQYDEFLENSATKNAQLNRELEQTKSELNDCITECETAKANVFELETAKKTLELKLRASEEKMENQSRTMKAQYDAQLQLMLAESTERLNSAAADTSSTIEAFSLKMKKYGIQTNKSSLIDFLDSICYELCRRHDTQLVYEETVSDLTRVQRLLGLPSSSNIFEAVSALSEHCQKLELLVKETEQSRTDDKRRIEEYIADIRRTESQIESLRQWESWARRMHRIVKEQSCSTYTAERVRLSLEEVLLSSVSHKGLLNRLDLLREQKLAFAKFGAKLTSTEGSQRGQGSWRSIIAVCVWCRRMSRLSGYAALEDAMRTPTTSQLSLLYDLGLRSGSRSYSNSSNSSFDCPK